MEGDEKWLAGLKVGDVVATDHRPSYSQVDHFAIHKVIIAGKVHLVLSGMPNCKFLRRTGRYGRGFDAIHIQPVTAEIRASVQRRRLLNRVADIKWVDVATSRLARVLAIVEASDDAGADLGGSD